MSSPKKLYRVYCFDVASNQLSGDVIYAASDEDAIAMAQSLATGTKCELWEGRRLVAQIEGERRLA